MSVCIFHRLGKNYIIFYKIIQIIENYLTKFRKFLRIYDKSYDGMSKKRVTIEEGKHLVVYLIPVLCRGLSD